MWDRSLHSHVSSFSESPIRIITRMSSPYDNACSTKSKDPLSYIILKFMFLASCLLRCDYAEWQPSTVTSATNPSSLWSGERGWDPPSLFNLSGIYFCHNEEKHNWGHIKQSISLLSLLQDETNTQVLHRVSSSLKWLSAVACPTLPCIRYFPVVVIEHHDQKQFKEQRAMWVYGSRGRVHGGEEDMAGWQNQEAVRDGDRQTQTQRKTQDK